MKPSENYSYCTNSSRRACTLVTTSEPYKKLDVLNGRVVDAARVTLPVDVALTMAAEEEYYRYGTRTKALAEETRDF